MTESEADLGLASGSVGTAPIPPPCQRCGVLPASVIWGDTMTVIHGGGQEWCERCAVEVQTVHARERAAVLATLERRLVELGGPATAVCECSPSMLTVQACAVHGEVDYMARWKEAAVPTQPLAAPKSPSSPAPVSSEETP